MEQLTDRDHAELLMLYQVTIDDIEKTKQWGWTVTYTTIAAQGAILGLFSVYKAGTYLVWAKVLFILLTIGLAILGIKYIGHSEASPRDFRERIKLFAINSVTTLKLLLENPLKKRSDLLNL